MRQSVFERYGGFARVSRVVTAFYDKVLDSPITSPYFDHTDMRRLIDHQTRFLSQVMGGPASYTDDQLERVHARLHITDEAFDEVAMLLRETLEDMDFEPEDVTMVCDAIVARRRYIVSGER